MPPAALFSISLYPWCPCHPWLVLVLVAIVRGRLSSETVKDTVEIRRAGEAELAADLIDRQRRIAQQALGLPDLELIEVGNDAAAIGPVKCLFGPGGTH